MSDELPYIIKSLGETKNLSLSARLRPAMNSFEFCWSISLLQTMKPSNLPKVHPKTYLLGLSFN